MRITFLCLFLASHLFVFSQSLSVYPANIQSTYQVDSINHIYPTEKFVVKNNGTSTIDVSYTTLSNTMDDLNWVAASCCFFFTEGSTIQVAPLQPGDSLDFTAQIIQASKMGTGEVEVLIHDYADTTGVVITYKASLVGNLDTEENYLDLIDIYPNPTSGVVYINEILGNTDVYLFDMLGKQYPVGFSGQRIDLSPLPDGMYVLQFIQKDEQRSVRIIKE